MDRPRPLVGPFVCSGEANEWESKAKVSDNNTSKCEITVKLALEH